MILKLMGRGGEGRNVSSDRLVGDYTYIADGKRLKG